MRYLNSALVALALAFGLVSGRAWSVDAEVDVKAGGAAIDISFFNEHLASDGKWVEVATYGRVWQPAVVLTETEWRPYLNGGHWRLTDAGWYWESSYPWGWAVFHYGRWNYDEKYKWVWLPDTTWGPAWVSWRQSDTTYGWAPLPFGARFEGGAIVGANIEVRADLYSFVPATSFLEVNLTAHAVPRAQANTVFNQTKIVNNSYTVNNNVVVNNGIPAAQVAKATKQEVKPVPIADAKSPADKSSDAKVAAFRPVKNDPAKPAEKAPAGKPAEKAPAEKPAEKAPTEKPAEKAPAEKPAEKAPAEKPAEKAPAEKPAEGKGNEKNEGEKGR